MDQVARGCRTLEVGEIVLGRYRIEEEIAVGGHSVVYRGSDERLSRPVCVKVFDTRRTNPRVHRTSRDHFVQEAFALSGLTHPATLKIFDFGFLDDEGTDLGAPIQVSEFIGGGTLGLLVRDGGPLPPEEALRIVEDLSGAIDEAHSVGIIHRDIKPQNILFSVIGDRRVTKLADFGIAKRIFGESELQHFAEDTNVAAGYQLLMYSPSWASPEQILGKSVGPASDLFSLGLVTAFMLKGRAACKSRDPRSGFKRRVEVRKHLAEAARGIDLPSEMLEVLACACALSPEDRYPSATDFARAMREAIIDAGSVSLRLPVDHPPGPREKPETASVAEIGPWRAVRLQVDAPGQVDSRQLRFETLIQGEALLSVEGARFRVTLLPVVDNVPAFHIKGINCFVSLDGRPPSSAVTVSGQAVIDFFAPNRTRIARATTCKLGSVPRHILVAIGREAIALPVDEVPFAIGLDFGVGSVAVVLHTTGQKSNGSAKRSRKQRRS